MDEIFSSVFADSVSDTGSGAGLSEDFEQRFSISDAQACTSTAFENDNDARKHAEIAWEKKFNPNTNNDNCKSDRKYFKDWVKFLMNLDYYTKTIDKLIEAGTSKSKQHSQKSSAEAEEYRKLGTSIFIKKDTSALDKLARLEETLSNYTNALTLIPWNEITNQNSEIAIIFANRSAVFYELERYNEALSDIELAIKYGYPEHLKWKVYLRKANILLAIGKSKSEISNFIDEVINMKFIGTEMHGKFDSIKEKVKLIKSSSSSEKENHSQKTVFNEEIQWMNHRKYFTTPYVENPNFVYASSKLSLHYSNENGRHVIANSPINRGEILFDEEPYASVLLQDYRLTHCHHCQVNMLDYIIPCKCCSAVRYCSEKCATSSWDQYHQYECINESFLQSFGLCHLATRIVLIAGLDEVVNTVHKGSTDEVCETLEVFQKGKPAYYRVYSLDEHSSESGDMKFPFLEAAVTCTLFLKRKTEFFTNICDEDVYKIGGSILLHLFQLVVNAQRIYTLPSTFEEGLIDTGERISVGSAIFASTSMMNHCCDPQISTSYKLSCGQGRRFIVKAVNPINAGAEVCNSYGVTFRRDNITRRRLDLYEQYKFLCNCKICLQEMETNQSFADEFAQIRCQNKDQSCEGFLRIPIQTENDSREYLNSILNQEGSQFQCTDKNCHYRNNPSKILLVFNEIKSQRKICERLIQKGESEKAFKVLEKNLKFCQNWLNKNHYLLAEVEDEMAKFLIQHGNPKEAKDHLKVSLDYTKERYGSWSNEYGIELRKYAETLQLLHIESGSGSAVNLFAKSREILEVHSPSTVVG